MAFSFVIFLFRDSVKSKLVPMLRFVFSKRQKEKGKALLLVEDCRYDGTILWLF